MGVGNFFGMLPDTMADSRLYGVELDSITGRLSLIHICHVAAALEIYVKGSLNIFNHHTNVDIHNRIVCFDIKQRSEEHTF